MNSVMRKASIFWKNNGATVLTYIGVAGVVATSVATVKATTKASKLIDEATKEKGEELTKIEVLKVAGPVYIPAVLFGAATVSCIIGSNVINKQKQASLVGAYVMLDKSFKEYRAKVTELFGEDANGQVNEEIAKEKEIPEDDGKELFYDVYSKRYFRSTLPEVLNAQKEINRIMCTGWGASLNEYYELLGMKGIDEYSELGWSTYMMEDMYWHAWIEFAHREMEMEDGTKCTVIEIPLEPFIEYLD